MGASLLPMYDLRDDPLSITYDPLLLIDGIKAGASFAIYAPLLAMDAFGCKPLMAIDAPLLLMAWLATYIILLTAENEGGALIAVPATVKAGLKTVMSSGDSTEHCSC